MKSLIVRFGVAMLFACGNSPIVEFPVGPDDSDPMANNPEDAGGGTTPTHDGGVQSDSNSNSDGPVMDSATTSDGGAELNPSDSSSNDSASDAAKDRCDETRCHHYDDYGKCHYHNHDDGDDDDSDDNDRDFHEGHHTNHKHVCHHYVPNRITFF